MGEGNTRPPQYVIVVDDTPENEALDMEMTVADRAASMTQSNGEIAAPIIHMTEAALDAVREMIGEVDLPAEGGLRLSAHTGAGCSAPLQYGMTLEPGPGGDDAVLEFPGVRIFMDPESAWVLDGLLVDYVTSSPMGEGFGFRHPNGRSGRACQ